MTESEQDPPSTLVCIPASSQQTIISKENDQHLSFSGRAFDDQENIAVKVKRRKLNHHEDASNDVSEVIKNPTGEENLRQPFIEEKTEGEVTEENDQIVNSEVQQRREKITIESDSSLSDSTNSSQGGKKYSTSKNETKSTEKVLNISLVPENRDILSDYNLMLTENVQFFEVSKSYNINDGAVGFCVDGLPSSKVGLRCIHCPSYGRHITAASFFPSSITSIASGLGTIGARHFIGGKCPYISNEMVESLRQNKKTSQQQTRMQGRIGLDAYCRGLAQRKNIRNLEIGGIQLGEIIEATSTSSNKRKVTTRQTTQSFRENKERVEPATSYEIDRDDPSAFVEGSVEHFWECKHCISLPHHWRASGSVVFSADVPTLNMVKKHLGNCQGKIPLLIPRNAKIQTKENESGPSVVINWENLDNRRRKSGRIHKRLIAAESAKKKRSNSIITTIANQNCEDEPLVFSKDKLLTTDFAHFTFLQLKKCHLTKAGGSRGNCPLGYPGLACRHCAGTASPRRFFYTSADHLRNSFSHIPSHLATCSKCPDDVKRKIEDLKARRSKQKSQLKVGDHKQFIDRVWDRLHGPDGGIIDILNNNNGEISDEDSISSISVEAQSDYHSYQNLSIKGLWLESDHIIIEPTPSFLVFAEDRKDVVDYTFYSILQMTPKLLVSDSNKIESGNSTGGIQNGAKESNCLDQSKSACFQNFMSNDSRINHLNGGDLDKNATGLVRDGNTSENSDACVDQNESNETTYLETPTLLSSQTRTNDDSNSRGQQDDIDNVTTTSEKRDKEDKSSIKTYTIVCKFCNGEEYGRDDIFLPKSPCELRKGFPKIPKHLLSCNKCPNKVKEKLRTFKSQRATQEAFLKRDAQNKFINVVWSRLKSHFTEPAAPLKAFAKSHNMSTKESIPSSVSQSLLTEDDRSLVTQFTFFTMEQMKPCFLEKSGNGARSMFQYGFPGLSCIHCADTSSARKFFYRTSDILSGNYAHIPNHVLSCKHCPQHIKKTLAEKKKIHVDEKMRLHRGSQRIFFSNVWERLHCRH